MPELTDKLLRNMRPPESGRIELSDTKRKGLRIRLTAAGKASWLYEKSVKGGGRIRETLGSYPAVSLANVRELTLGLEAEASQGIDRFKNAKIARANAEAKQASRKTVADVLAIYIQQHLSGLRQGQERHRQLDASLANSLTFPIEALTRGTLQAAVDEKLNAGKDVMANRVAASLKAFTRWAFQRGYLETDVGAGVVKPGREKPRDRVLSLDEVRAIWRASHNLGTLWGPFLRLLILTAQRRGDILGLDWSEVNFELCRIELAGARTKNGKSHVTHLAAPALAELSAMHNGQRTGLVFSTTGTTAVSGVSKAKRRLDASLSSGFEAWTLHDLRTAFATAMAEAGEPEPVVDRILNHLASGSAPSAVARVYNRAEQLPQRATVLERWAEMVVQH
ncbi:MAG: tyrosine-type recombinase/integrase [Pseudomonadota bacterium]